MVDTFQYWRFGDYKNYTSLKLLAAALGVPSPKDDIDGSMVADVYWNEKNLQRIVTYCQKDVLTTANIVLRFKNMPMCPKESMIKGIAEDTKISFSIVEIVAENCYQQWFLTLWKHLFLLFEHPQKWEFLHQFERN